MNLSPGVLALCLLTSPAIAKNKTRPCEGAEGAFRTNPDATQGGFVALTASVSAETMTSVDSQVCDYAVIKGHATLAGEAIVGDRAYISGHVTVSDSAYVGGDSNLLNTDLGENLMVKDSARIFGQALLRGTVLVEGTSQVFGNAHIYDFVELHGSSKVCGASVLSENQVLTDDVTFCPNKK